MVKLIIVLSIITLLSIGMFGCETNNRAKIVKVPIIICPVPEHILDPILPVDVLTNEDKGDWEKIAKSYALSLVRQEAYIEKLKAQLEVYRSSNGEIVK